MSNPNSNKATTAGLDGKVALVTGAGAGLGRAEAIYLASQGARVVVSDLNLESAEAVSAEIRDAGGESTSFAADVGEWSSGAGALGAAIDSFGQLDILVNNAGITRERMIFNMSEEDFDSVIKVHLKGHFVMLRAATAYWRQRAKEAGAPVYGRVINTSSEAFLTGAPAQPNYAAAKAGIVALTMSVARSCEKYGVRANVICPRARTAMTDPVFASAPDHGVDPMSVDHVTPLVGLLSAPSSDEINGQVFVVYGGQVALLNGPSQEQVFMARDGSWVRDELESELRDHFTGRPERLFAVTDIGMTVK